MKDFQTEKSIKLLEEARIGGKDIYINLSTINALEIAKLSETIEQNPVETTLKLVQMLFTPESYELVKFMDLEDLSDLVDIVLQVLNKQEVALVERFKRPE